MWRRATAREPTGSPVSTYSAMTARSTCRFRWSKAAAVMSASILPLEQLGEQGVGEQEAGLGEPDAARRPRPAGRARARRRAPRAAARARDRSAPRGARRRSRRSCEGPGSAARPGAWRGGQHLVSGDRELPGLDEGGVALHRLDVAVAHVAEEAARARSERRGTPPIASSAGCGASGSRGARSWRPRSARSRPPRPPARGPSTAR